MVDCCVLAPSPSSPNECSSNGHYQEDVYKPRNLQHQVAGHIGLSSPDELHVCKPCGNRELAFYMQMPESLRAHTAKLCGYAKGVSGVFQPAASLSCSYCTSTEGGQRLRERLVHHTQNISKRPLEGNTNSPLMRRRLRKAGNCVVLSNLAAHCEHPCVADLKLGTRQYGDGATEEKKAAQEEKCRLSTSAEHGVRLGGMRFFDPSLNEYVSVDKYAGREMNSMELEKSLQSFFGSSKMQPVIVQRIIERIDAMIESLSSCSGIRLFGASLLIVFDGADTDVEQSEVECKLVDFANATYPGFLDDPIIYSTPDEGCVLGLRTIRTILSNLNC